MSTNPPLPDSQEPRQSGHRHALWLRILGWAAASVGVLIVLIVIAAAILLNTSSGRGYLVGLAENKATAALGVPVHIRDFHVHLTSLSVEIDGLTIEGALPYRTPPLLTAPHIAVSVGISSIWGAKWYLDSIRIDHPTAHIFKAKNGASNLPKKQGGGGGKIDVFNLGIRHLALNHGEVIYNDRKMPLEADLHELNFQAIYHPVRRAYSGTLSYRNGELRAGSFQPPPSNLDVRFDAGPKEFRLTQLKLTSGHSQFEVAGTLRDYQHPQAEAQYTAILDVRSLRSGSGMAVLPAGEIRTRGSLKYQSAPGVPMLDSITLRGTLASRQLTIQPGSFRAELQDLTAKYSLSAGNAAVENLHANLLGGRIAADVRVDDLAGAQRGKLNATVRDVSLAQLKRAAPTPAAARNVSLAGVLNATAEGSWRKSIKNLVLRTDATLRARASRSAGVVPVNGAIHATYNAAKKELAIAHSSFQLPQTRLTLNGTIGTTGKRAALAIQFHSRDLGELETIADLVRTPKPGESLPPLGLGGTATFQGTVRGSTATPHLTGQLTASNLHLKGTQWRRLQTGVELDPSLAHLQNGVLEPADRGDVRFDASVHLTKWKFEKTNPIQVSLRASDLDLANLKRIAGPGTRFGKIPVSGTLAADVTAHGSLVQPVGHGEVSLERAKFNAQPIPSAKVAFTAADGQIHGNLSVQVAGGSIDGTVETSPTQKTYTAQLSATGIEIGRLAALQDRDIEAVGTFKARGSGQGTFSDPQFKMTAEIPTLKVQEQVIKNTNLQMSVANHVAIADLRSETAQTSVQANAKVNLTGDYMTQATLDTQKIPLEPLLALYAPAEAAWLKGETEVHATLRGPLKNKKAIEAHVTIPILNLTYRNAIHLAATSPLHADYTNGVINLQQAEIRGTDTDLQIKGTVPVAGNAPVSLLVKGTMDLKIARLLSPGLRSSGQLQFDIDSYGARADPEVEGQVRIVNASFSNDSMPIGLRRGNGVLVLTKHRLNIQSFEGDVGGGTITAQGGVTYRPSIQFDLAAAAKGIQMLYPEGMREQIGADIRMTGTQQNALLSGRVRIEDLSFTPDFDMMDLIGNFSGGVAAPPSRGFLQNLNLNLAVSSESNLNLVSRTMSFEGAANLRVRGTAAQPVILGRIDITGGDLIFSGNRFTLAGGTIEFINPAQTQPVVNLALNTTIQQYNISMRFNGPVDRLRTNYSSDPSLPSADIINLLAFGQTLESSAVNPTPGNQAAMSAVASQVSSQLTSRVAKIAGISQLSIDPVLAGGSTQGPAGAIVTVQQRVTGNLFVTFSTNVATTQNQVIMGQYRLSPRVSVSATRDQNGGFAFDTSFKKSW